MIIEPTEEMLTAAADWSRAKYGKPIGNADAIGCWKAMAAAAPQDWKCRARATSLPEPQDCDWPLCGCDPHADKVIAALQESGKI